MASHHVGEHWQTVYSWLKLCGIHINKTFCREEITTHPDYPSLLSIVDFLEVGGMKYHAIRSDLTKVQEFNYPLLAHIKKPGEEFLHIVTNTSSWAIENEIAQNWSGIILYPEKDATWKNAENNKYAQNAHRNKTASAIFILIGISIVAASSYEGFTSGTLGIFKFLFGILSLLGVVISLFALSTELGLQSRLVKQVCGAVGSSNGCGAVLNSKASLRFFNITPADASVLYFAVQLCFYIISNFSPDLFLPLQLLY